MVISDLNIPYLTGMIDFFTKRQQGMTVGEIKKKFNLTEEEYQKLYDLSLPSIRTYAGEVFWRNAYKNFTRETWYILHTVEDPIECRDKIEKLLKDHSAKIERELKDVELKGENANDRK